MISEIQRNGLTSPKEYHLRDGGNSAEDIHDSGSIGTQRHPTRWS